MGPFITQTGMSLVADRQSVQSSFRRAAQITFQFRNIDVFISVGNIHPVVLIKQQRAIMEESLHIPFLPGPLYAVRRIQVGFMGVIGHKAYVESTLMITDGCGPHALAINILFPFQPLAGRTVQPVIYISRMFPVPKIIGTENFTSWHKMHGGTHHIISVFYTNHIRIRIVQPGDGIDFKSSHIFLLY